MSVYFCVKIFEPEWQW